MDRCPAVAVHRHQVRGPPVLLSGTRRYGASDHRTGSSVARRKHRCVKRHTQSGVSRSLPAGGLPGQAPSRSALASGPGHRPPSMRPEGGRTIMSRLLDASVCLVLLVSAACVSPSPTAPPSVAEVSPRFVTEAAGAPPVLGRASVCASTRSWNVSGGADRHRFGIGIRPDVTKGLTRDGCQGGTRGWTTRWGTARSTVIGQALRHATSAHRPPAGGPRADQRVVRCG